MGETELRENVQLIAYADRFGGSLPGLHEILDGPLAGLFAGVHVLPFFTRSTEPTPVSTPWSTARSTHGSGRGTTSWPWLATMR